MVRSTKRTKEFAINKVIIHPNLDVAHDVKQYGVSHLVSLLAMMAVKKSFDRKTST